MLKMVTSLLCCLSLGSKGVETEPRSHLLVAAMKIAVEGCCHGELDKIYETIAYLEKKEGVKVDLLLCCGDFQAVRNEGDLKCMAVPAKYRTMQTFYKSVPLCIFFLQVSSGLIFSAKSLLQVLFW